MRTWKSLGLALAVAFSCGDDDGGGGGETDAGRRDAGGGGDVDVGPPRDGGGGGIDSGPGGACEPPPAFDVGATYAREIFVDTGGDDANDGSSGSPVATLRQATRLATPGTRIVVRAGTYGTGYIENLQGTAAEPIAIVGEGNPVFDAAGMGEALHFTDPRYLTIQGITIQGATANGINIDDGGTPDSPAHFVVLRGITVRDVGSGGNNDCVKLSGLDDYWVLDSDISSCNAGDAIDHVGCHDGVIHGNLFHDTLGSGGIQAKGGSADILIHGNRFIDVNARAINAGGSTGLEFFRPIDAPYEGARIIVVANVFVRPGANSGAPIAFVGCDACVFAHNTVIEPQTWIARILQESTDARFVPSRNGLYVNNIIVFNMADLRAWVNVGPGTAPDTFTFANNLWFALDTPGFTGPTYSDGIPPEMDPVVQMDPMLADRAGGDFHVAASSPAVGAGRAVMPAVPGDFEGNCYGMPPTIGAFEPR